MISRFDLVLISACLASGAMAVENAQRVDLAASTGERVQPVRIQPVRTTVCAPPHPSSMPFAWKNPLEAAIGDITIPCVPPG
jgi:hypothetical protein